MNVRPCTRLRLCVAKFVGRKLEQTRKDTVATPMSLFSVCMFRVYIKVHRVCRVAFDELDLAMRSEGNRDRAVGDSGVKT